MNIATTGLVEVILALRLLFQSPCSSYSHWLVKYKSPNEELEVSTSAGTDEMLWCQVGLA